MNMPNLGFNSRLIHAGDKDDAYGSVATPIYQTSTFAFRNTSHGSALFTGEEEGFIYTRISNPTLTVLEDKLASLENGYRAIALSSGMAAVTTTYMALLEGGSHIVATDSIYGPSRSVLENHFAKYGVESTFTDTSKPENILHSIRANTKVLYLESPSNPTLKLTDLKIAADIAHKHNILVVVDNTFCSPYLQRPLDLGVDVVIHSLTKFINGHSDIIGGAIITKDPALYQKLRKTMVFMGGSMDPHQANMIIRGVKTLAIRMERSQENAFKIAKYLEEHPKVDWVSYPGLLSHPQHELAKRQMSGFGTIISFALKGDFKEAEIFMNNIKLAFLAVSLGGVESLIQHPASMTHSGVPKKDREQAGITDNLIRYSAGIEDAEDLIQDLSQAIDMSGRSRSFYTNRSRVSVKQPISS